MRQGKTKGITIYLEDFDELVKRMETGEKMPHMIHKLIQLTAPFYNRDGGKFGRKKEK